MKVRELIEKLRKLNQDHEVFMDSDSEGNSTRRLADVEEFMFLIEDDEISNVHPDDFVNGHYDDVAADVQSAVVLFPQ